MRRTCSHTNTKFVAKQYWRDGAGTCTVKHLAVRREYCLTAPREENMMFSSGEQRGKGPLTKTQSAVENAMVNERSEAAFFSLFLNTFLSRTFPLRGKAK